MFAGLHFISLTHKLKVVCFTFGYFFFALHTLPLWFYSFCVSNTKDTLLTSKRASLDETYLLNCRFINSNWYSPSLLKYPIDNLKITQSWTLHLLHQTWNLDNIFLSLFFFFPSQLLPNQSINLLVVTLWYMQNPAISLPSLLPANFRIVSTSVKNTTGNLIKDCTVSVYHFMLYRHLNNMVFSNQWTWDFFPFSISFNVLQFSF